MKETAVPIPSFHLIKQMYVVDTETNEIYLTFIVIIEKLVSRHLENGLEKLRAASGIVRLIITLSATYFEPNDFNKPRNGTETHNKCK